MSRYQLSAQKFLNERELTELRRVLDLYAIASPRDTLLIELSLATGARESELLNLTTGDLNHFDRSIRIQGLKGSNSREIPLRDALFKRLATYSKGLDGKVFSITARRFRQIWEQYRPVKKKLHSLRHTFAIELYKKHRDLRLVQVALGHRNIQNTMVYAEYLYQTAELRRLIC